MNNLRDSNQKSDKQVANGKTKKSGNRESTGGNNGVVSATSNKQSFFESGQPSLAIPGLKILDFVGKPDPVGLEQARRDLEIHVGREMTFESEIFNINGTLHQFIC